MDATGWNERYAASDPVWSLTPSLIVERELTGLPAGSAVDLAAGEGRHAIWLARRGWSVTAVDFAQNGLDRGRELAGDLPVTWVCADATSWVAPEPVDLVVAAYLQLPTDQRRAAVESAWRSLTVGGTLLWVAHDSTNLTEGTGGPDDPDVLMTAEDVVGDLDAIGADYDTVRADRIARTVGDGHGEEESQIAWDCLARVVRRS